MSDYTLYYWPLPFRGNYIRNILVYCEQSYDEVEFEKIVQLKETPPGEQLFPTMSPPLLIDQQANRSINQMPAIAMYLGQKHKLVPEDPYQQALTLKILMDCTDFLASITNHNGFKMWDYEAWTEYRTKKLPRWLAILEETVTQFGNGKTALGTDCFGVADFALNALLGTVQRCLPELTSDLKLAPTALDISNAVGENEAIARLVREQEEQWGPLYCGGFIEESIREMLRLDQAHTQL